MRRDHRSQIWLERLVLDGMLAKYKSPNNIATYSGDVQCRPVIKCSDVICEIHPMETLLASYKKSIWCIINIALTSTITSLFVRREKRPRSQTWWETLALEGMLPWLQIHAEPLYVAGSYENLFTLFKLTSCQAITLFTAWPDVSMNNLLYSKLCKIM